MSSQQHDKASWCGPLQKCYTMQQVALTQKLSLSCDVTQQQE